MIRWILVFNEEAKAPPIVINNTTPEEDKQRRLLPSANVSLPVTNNAGLTETNFSSTGLYGKSGYAPSGLGQPCYTESTDFTDANLPKTNTTQKCDQTKGLECITGIYEGTGQGIGGICLRYVNQPCQILSDCSPEAELCINQICQTEGEVINKPCFNDIDCKGELGNLNHVCDPDSKLCVYDIWPNDSGCTNVNQCLYNKGNPGEISCLTSGGMSGYVLSFTGTYNGTSIQISGVENYKQFNPGLYVAVFQQSPLIYFGRYLVVSGVSIPSQQMTSVTLDGFSGTQTSKYKLDFGTKRDGICVINTPEGAVPETIPGTKQKYPCDSGLKTSKSGYCLTQGRVEKDGNVEEICIYETSIGCSGTLVCTYDQATVDSFSGNIGGAYVTTNSEGVLQISGNDIKNIGKCKNQIKELYQNCQDNCIKEYVCLTEQDINGTTFSYCGNEWDIMNDRSNLNDCPDGFSLDNNTLKCLSSRNNFCFSTSNCVSGTTCTGIVPTYAINTLYDPSTQTFSKNTINTSIGKTSNLLVSTDYGTDGKSTGFLGYYYKSGTNTWKIYYSLNGGSFEEDNSVIVVFDETPVNPPIFSVIKKSNGNYQVNVQYILEYPNNRQRTFSGIDSNNLYYSGLKNGTSVYFSGQSGIYSLDFSAGNINLSGTDMTLQNVIDSDGITVPVTSSFGDMITYDSRYTSNIDGTGFTISDNSGRIYSGDQFLYYSNSGSSINYQDDSSNTFNLSDGTSYYSLVFNSIDTTNNVKINNLFFSEDYNSVHSNPYLRGSYLNNLDFNTTTSSGLASFDGDNSYVQMKSLYGLNFLPIELTTFVPTVVKTIKTREEYVSVNGNDTFNFPIGYMSDTLDINAEILEDSIFVTYDYNGSNLNQTIKLNYTIDPDSSASNSYNSIINTDSTYIVNYTFDNSFRSPVPSIPGSDYQIDEVRSFDENNSPDNTDTVKFLTTYKNINPISTRTAVGNISQLRKVSTVINYDSDPAFDFKYQGLDAGVNPDPYQVASGVIPFGLTFGVNISTITESLTTTSTKNNIFLGGTNLVVFRNQDDIDVILKYGASDLVIGYGNYSRAITITGIKNYQVDISGEQTLNVEINILLNYDEKIQSPILYVNNIYPITLEGNHTISDGRNLFTSCVSKNMVSESSYYFKETSYNKILTQITGNNLNNYAFFSFYIFYQGSIDTIIQPLTLTAEYIVSQQSVPGIIANFKNSEVSINVSPSLGGNYAYICNDKYLSTNILSQEAYLNNINIEGNFSLISKYTNISGSSSNKIIGQIQTKEDTFPFYTGGLGKPGALDESYLSKIMWSYWIKNLNTGSLKISKIFLNWNPGNMENNMFYYSMVEINGVSMLLYLSPNFAVNSIKESEPVPVFLNSGETNSQFYMLPFNKNLVILSGSCKSV